jgi:hypothetical protein
MMHQEAQQLQDYLELECSDNPAEIAERIRTLSVYLARSGRMMAEAKIALRRRQTAEISAAILNIAKQQHLSARVQNTLLDSIAEEEAYMVDWTERINRSCTHQIDALRSLLSYEKEQLRLSSLQA